MKLTTWNAEWLDTDWGVVSGKYAPGQKIFPQAAPARSVAQKRIEAVGCLIDSLEADILLRLYPPNEAIAGHLRP